MAALLVFAFTACSPANPGQHGQRADGGSIRGIVTAVSASSIEIAKMENGNRQGNPPPGAPSGTPGGSPNRQPPNNGQAPGGNPQAQSSPDTSKMEKATYTIDASTQIVKQEFEQGTGQSKATPNKTAAGISDIQQGTMVTITLKAGSDKAAAKIVIMQGFGKGNTLKSSSSPAAGAGSST